jgi:tetratricopeptide (TPR) repeat protein
LPSHEAALRVLCLAPRPTDLPTAAALPLTHTEALCEAIETQGEAATWEWLWPPTPQALASRLADGAARPVHVLALDALITEAGLALEDKAGELAPLPLDALAKLIRGAGVKLVLLRQAPDQADLGADLAAASGAAVFTWHPSLSGKGLQAAASALLAALLAGQPQTDALVQARAGLRALPHSARLAATPAQDWPAAAVNLALGAQAGPLVVPDLARRPESPKILRFPRGDDASALAPAWRSLPLEPLPGGLTPEPEPGFYGRGAELRLLERCLASEPGLGPVWIHGYQGLGKTTLAAHVGRWLVRCGRLARVVRTDWAGGGLPEEALYDLAYQLGNEELLAGGDPVGAIAQELEATPTLIIWDHLDAVLGEGEFPLEREMLTALWELAQSLNACGASRLVIITDTPAMPPEAATLGNLGLSLRLGPLAEDDAVDLWGVLLEAQRAQPPELQGAYGFVRTLGGHPLALRVLGALPGHSSLAEIEAALEQVLPAYARGEARLRNQALDAALEVFMRHLGEEARAGLAPVGLYARGLMEPLALRLLGMDEALWARNKRQLVAAGLVEDQRLVGFNVPYVRLHPALARYLGLRLAGPQRAALSHSYNGAYAGLLHWLSQAEARAPEHVRLLARRELPNLRRALRGLLERNDMETARSVARWLHHFMTSLHLTSEAQQITRRMSEAMQALVPAEGPLSRPGVRLLLTQADEMLNAGQGAQAGALLKELIERISAEKGLSYAGDEAQLDRATAMSRMGRLMRLSGRMDVAAGLLNQAIELLQPLAVTDEVLRLRLWVYSDLTEVVMAIGAIEPAQDAATRGLALAQQLEDRASEAGLQLQLGALALATDAVDAAWQHLDAAAALYAALEQPDRQAAVCEAQAMLAARLDEHDRAQGYLEQGLALVRQAQLAAQEAHLLTRLAELSQSQGNMDAAEGHYSQALAIFQQHRMLGQQVGTEMALARLMLAQGQTTQAGQHANTARVITETVARASREQASTGEPFDGGGPWEVYALLQEIAAAEQDAAGVARWRALTQQVYASSPAAANLGQQWQHLIQSVAACGRGQAMEAELLEAVEKLEATEQWRELAGAIWRILGGERGDDLWAEMDHVDAFLVRAMLEAIARPEEAEQAGDEQSSA